MPTYPNLQDRTSAFLHRRAIPRILRKQVRPVYALFCKYARCDSSCPAARKNGGGSWVLAESLSRPGKRAARIQRPIELMGDPLYH